MKIKFYNENIIDNLASTKNPSTFWKIVNKSHRKSNIPDQIDLALWAMFFKNAQP